MNDTSWCKVPVAQVLQSVKWSGSSKQPMPLDTGPKDDSSVSLASINLSPHLHTAAQLGTASGMMTGVTYAVQATQP